MPNQRSERPASGLGDGGGGDGSAGSPGKRSRTARIQRKASAAPSPSPEPAAEVERADQGDGLSSAQSFLDSILLGPVQRKASAAGEAAEDVHALAAAGTSGPAERLPFLDRIQASFGDHDVSGVAAHTGGAAASSAQAMGASAFASGNDVAFAGAPDLHTAAHEAAHVVQQRGGVQLKGGVGAEGDAYERHADEVAAAVVRGESAEALLDVHAVNPGAGGGTGSVQRAPRAAAPLTADDESERIRLALRGARNSSLVAIDTARTKASESFSESNRRYMFKAEVQDVLEHLEIAQVNVAGRTDHKPYAKEAAAAVAPVAELVGVAPGMDVDAEAKALTTHAGRVAGWAGTTKPELHPKRVDAKDEEQTMILALRAVRETCDGALGDRPDPTRVDAAGTFAQQDIVYAYSHLTGFDRERHAPDVDVATRSLGRLIGWVKEATRPGNQQAPLHLTDTWIRKVTWTANQMRMIVGLPQAGWISDVVDGNIVAADPERPDKAAAQQALNGWNDASLETIEAVRRWTTNNWIAFIGATSKNPRLSWDMNIFDQTASNLVGNLLTAFGENLIKKGSAAIAGALIGLLAGPVGAVIGFVIGLVIETIAAVAYDYIFGDHGKKEDGAARDAAKRTGKLAEAKHEEFSTAADAGRKEQKKAFEVVQANLNDAGSKTKVEGIEKGLKKDQSLIASPKNPSDKSLYKAMLRDWVLENAGDEEDANKETSEAQWEDAVKETFGTDQIENRRDVFAFQTRGEWIKAGFDPADVRARTEAMRAMARRWRSDEVGVYSGKEAPLPAVTSTAALRAYLAQNSRGIYEDDMREVEKDPRNLSGTVELDLNKADGTTYVNSWTYRMTFKRLPDLERKFKVSPD